jgi:hypothetical protein
LDGLFELLGHTDGLDIKYGDIKRIPVRTAETDELTGMFAQTILKLGDSGMVYGTSESATLLDVVNEFGAELGLGGAEASI